MKKSKKPNWPSYPITIGNLILWACIRHDNNIQVDDVVDALQKHVKEVRFAKWQKVRRKWWQIFIFKPQEYIPVAPELSEREKEALFFCQVDSAVGQVIFMVFAKEDEKAVKDALGKMRLMEVEKKDTPGSLPEIFHRVHRAPDTTSPRGYRTIG